jgi:hypothetical protein
VQASLRAIAHSTANRERARQLVWQWVGSKWPRLIPSTADMKRDAIRRSAPGQELSVEQCGCGDVCDVAWTLSIAHRDGKANRTWLTQVVVRDAGDADLMIVRASCIGDLDAALVVAPPRLLGLWVEHLDLTDGGFAVIGEPRAVNDSQQGEAFCDHVLSGKRTLPVIALMSSPHSRYYGVDPNGLAEAVRGLAHVACLSESVIGIVAERLGSALVPSSGAARIYSPDFATTARQTDHPLVKPPQRRVDARSVDPGSFRRMLVQRVCAISVDAAAGAPDVEPWVDCGQHAPLRAAQPRTEA